MTQLDVKQMILRIRDVVRIFGPFVLEPLDYHLKLKDGGGRELSIHHTTIESWDVTTWVNTLPGHVQIEVRMCSETLAKALVTQFLKVFDVEERETCGRCWNYYHGGGTGRPCGRCKP